MAEKGKLKTVPTEHSQGPSYYTNAVGLDFSIFDLTLHINVKKAPEAEQEHICDVMMSPQHAKVFAQMLTAAVGKFEKSFGEI